MNSLWNEPQGRFDSDGYAVGDTTDTTQPDFTDESFGIAFDADGHPIVPNVLVDWRALTTAERERDVNIPGSGHNLRNYWVRGPGAAKIGWGTDGSFARCVAQLGKYVTRPQGLCAEYHKQATGEWPAEKGIPSEGDTTALSVDDSAHDTSDSTVAAAEDSKKPYGDVAYADPGYQDDKVQRYPLDTESHVRAAWAYINMPKNAAMYKPSDLRRVRARIAAAMRKIGVEVQASAQDQPVAFRYIDVEVVPKSDKSMTAGTTYVVSEPTDNEQDDMSTTKEDNVNVSDDDAASEVLITPVSHAPWEGILTVEGVKSGDARMFALNSLTWDAPPLPLMWQKETSHGGDNNVSVRVGSIDNIWREPAGDGSKKNIIMGSGTLDLGCADGREVFRRMRDGYMSGNSVDVDSVSDSNITLEYPMQDPGGNGAPSVYGKPSLTTYNSGRIRATTLVEIPAFTEAHLALTNVTASTVPMHDVEQIDEEITTLVAATSVITIPDTPPRSWFNEPTDVPARGALTVTNDGRVYGYVAPAGVRHRSFPGREQYVPLGNVDYSRFMSGETIVDDGGRVTTGRITMNCGHATTRRTLTAAQAADHYDNSCSIVANVRVGENSNGVWVAGALLPDVTPAMIQRMMACSLSGDWRGHLDKPGMREFVAALLVPVPGFPMARRAPSIEMRSGELVASSVPVTIYAASSEPTVDVEAVHDDAATEPVTASTDVTITEHTVAALTRRVKVAKLRAVVRQQ